MSLWTESDLLAFLARQKKRSCNSFPETAATQQPAGTEAKLQDQIISELRKRGWYYINPRRDKPSTIAVGAPDFVIFAPGGRVFSVECKSPAGKQRPSQLAAQVWLEKLGHPYFIVRSFPAFLQLLSQESSRSSAATDPPV